MDHQSAQSLSMDKRVLFLRVCLWIGVVADLLATLPLLFPEMARLMFGLQAAASGKDYLYVSRIGASLWIFYALIIPLYVIAYSIAVGVEKNRYKN